MALLTVGSKLGQFEESSNLLQAPNNPKKLGIIPFCKPKPEEDGSAVELYRAQLSASIQPLMATSSKETRTGEHSMHKDVTLFSLL